MRDEESSDPQIAKEGSLRGGGEGVRGGMGGFKYLLRAKKIFLRRMYLYMFRSSLNINRSSRIWDTVESMYKNSRK